LTKRRDKTSTCNGGYGYKGSYVIGKGGRAKEVDFIIITDAVTIGIDEIGSGVVFLLF
jgi:hypothetical protein